MKYKDPQWKRLYDAMQKGKRLTALDVFKVSGSLNAHKRMQDVTQHTGKVVYRDWKPGKRRIREFFMKGSYR